MAKSRLEIENKSPVGNIFSAAFFPALGISALLGALGFGILVAFIPSYGVSMWTVGKKWWAIGHTAIDSKLSLLMFGLPGVCIGWNFARAFILLAG